MNDLPSRHDFTEKAVVQEKLVNGDLVYFEPALRMLTEGTKKDRWEAAGWLENELRISLAVAVTTLGQMHAGLRDELTRCICEGIRASRDPDSTICLLNALSYFRQYASSQQELAASFLDAKGESVPVAAIIACSAIAPKGDEVIDRLLGILEHRRTRIIRAAVADNLFRHARGMTEEQKQKLRAWESKERDLKIRQNIRLALKRAES